MYLKQLICKGFKSFADRSVLELEPGITAVVGPNGSGKSNISDAVLWVLGERNAKNLRGQVMEDVIFAGSSARKSVGVAEVSLVLDNSDGSLPVDYNEVTISRRMYRNGESEYLINGSTVRRLDVLDILHDSGLGTGTHSIISQGHLDSILQSKPEDRRALIEEAAGVLKHKQRKEKSQRKIAQMDLHLARVNDVVSEIERQLGPLQRKARKAIQYKEISSQLDEVKLALAVDDLRNLQAQWNSLADSEQAAQDELALRRAEVQQREGEYDALQERILRENSDAAKLAATHMKAVSLGERFDSLSILLAEKKRVAEQRSIELNRVLETNAAKRIEMQEERAKASEELQQARDARSNAQAAVDNAQKEYDQAHGERLRLEQELSTHQRQRGNAEREAEIKRRELASIQEKLSRGVGQAQAAGERLADIEARVNLAKAELVDAEARLKASQEEAQEYELKERAASELMVSARNERDRIQKEADALKSEIAKIEAELKGIKEVERAMMAAAGAAHSWVSQQSKESWGRVIPLLEGIDVEPGYEALVERLLGDDVTALLVEGTDELCSIDSDVRNAGQDGIVTMYVSGRELSPSVAERGVTLISKVSCADSLSATVAALLGDVVVCDNLDEALRLQSSQPHLRYVARDGSLLWPDGKVQIGNVAHSQDGAALARSRRLKELEKGLSTSIAQLSKLNDQVESSRKRANDAQEESLALRQSLASIRGQLLSVQREHEGLNSRLRQTMSEHESSLRAQKSAEQIVAECEPKAAEAKLALSKLEAEAEAEKQLASEVRNKLFPLRDREQILASKLADAKVSFATLTERETFAAKTMDDRARELLSLSEADEEAFSALAAKSSARKRVDPLVEVISALAESVRLKADILSEQVLKAQDSSVASNAEASESREAVRHAHGLFDQAINKLSELRVEKGRLDLKVQASVDYIVKDCHTTMEAALELPALEDRAAAEDQSFKLQRRIANLGTINPDAAQEYEELKQRYDFLKAQLDDLASARQALKKIDRVIDQRMKDDFVNTFHTVNGYFKEIFAELFPGGTAELSLVDPNDLENTGVEVTAQPRGKRITKMTLMSGGEKSLVACALLFAVYRTRTTPFYILDEIEAALDDSNLRRLITYLEELSHHTQLIMITHQRRTMEMADVLFGVSMQADGVTRVISQRLEKALQYAE